MDQSISGIPLKQYRDTVRDVPDQPDDVPVSFSRIESGAHRFGSEFTEELYRQMQYSTSIFIIH